MYLQETSWGQIEWLQTNNGSSTSHSMSIGIATILPHASQKSHIHYENEQFIYIMQGEGVDIINEEVSKFEKGTFYHIPPNVTHQILNTGDLPIKHLVVTVYLAERRPIAYELHEIDNYSDSLRAAAEAIRSQIHGPNSPPVTIFDDIGNLVLLADNYPSYCLEHCPLQKTPEKCACFCSNISEGDNISSIGLCPYGLTVLQTPVLYGTHYLGRIFSGHVYMGNQQGNHKIDMYETSTGTLLAIQTWVNNIVESIVGFCSFNATRQNLRLKDAFLEQSRDNQKVLEAHLKAMQNTVTNLRINHHFLFNTLNAIASQALLGDEVLTYQAITDLAKMFRYSTSEGSKNVPLQEELSYLKTYLHMQQLRYGNQLSTEITCPEALLDGLVPFNFLQPIVENAFTHGFVNMTGQRLLKIKIICQDRRLFISVENNGILIDEVTIKRVLAGMHNNSGHGLSLVYEKLQSTYNNDFSINMTSDAHKGTCVCLILPFLSTNPQGGDYA